MRIIGCRILLLLRHLASAQAWIYICEHFKCNSCDAVCEVYSRIVGYLRPISQWNEGKQAEYDIREMYSPETAPNSVEVFNVPQVVS